MKSADVPIVNPVVVLREEADDWAILFNPDTNQAVGVNPTGVLIWKLLDGRRNLDEVDREVRQRLSNVPDDSAGEILRFAGSLVESGFAAVEGT